jgi:hypothetical protein
MDVSENKISSNYRNNPRISVTCIYIHTLICTYVPIPPEVMTRSYFCDMRRTSDAISSTLSDTMHTRFRGMPILAEDKKKNREEQTGLVRQDTTLYD